MHTKSVSDKIEVVLVDSNNNKIGVEEKIEAHKKGLLHRAFSVFILNERNDLLLQKRQTTKYHSPDLWSNTCCGHQTDGILELTCVENRLKFEMGIECNLSWLLDFVYSVKFDNGLFENEYDRCYLGVTNNAPNINKEEVSDYKWLSMKDI